MKRNGQIKRYSGVMLGWCRVCRVQKILLSFVILLKANLNTRNRKEYFLGLFQPYTPYTPVAIIGLLFKPIPPVLVQMTMVHEPSL